MPANTLVFGPITDPINKDIFEELKDFERKVNARGAKMIVTFPAFQEESFNNIASKIKQVEQTYHGYGFKVIGTPEEYKFSNSLMYDTPYHLTIQGIEIRTQMLIKDLQDEAHIKKSHG